MIYSEIFDRAEMISSIDEFYNLYTQRPIVDNNGGMKSNHLFHTWFMVKKIRPKFIIESGVWKGLGTWFLEKASEKSKIFSFDPVVQNRIYTSSSVTYLSHDITKNDWSTIDKKNTLVFLDDHQNFFDRLIFCVENGFRYIIVEDNYPILQGDCYSPKKILSRKKYVIDKNGQKIFMNSNSEHYDYFINNVKKYQELPPFFKDNKTRWGDIWDDENYNTPSPLLTDENKYPILFEERKHYTWICFIEI